MLKFVLVLIVVLQSGKQDANEIEMPDLAACTAALTKFLADATPEAMAKHKLKVVAAGCRVEDTSTPS